MGKSITKECTKPEGANHLTGYRTYACRCPLCTKANTVRMKEWRHATGRTKMTLVPVKHRD